MAGGYETQAGQSFAADVAGEKLSDLLKTPTDPMKALTGEELEASSFVPGGEGAMESLETATDVSAVGDIGQSAVDPGMSTLPTYDDTDASGLFGGQSYEVSNQGGGDIYGMSMEELQSHAALNKEQGGYIPRGGQDQLMLMLALAQMQEQETAYSGTPLEEVQPTIAEIFASKGKTLGGNNTQSLSQINEQFA